MNNHIRTYSRYYYNTFVNNFKYALILLNRQHFDVFKAIDSILGSQEYKDIVDRKNYKILGLTSQQIVEIADKKSCEKDEAYKAIDIDKYASSLYGDIDIITADDYVDKESVKEDALLWLGELLVYFQWKYGIDMQEWLKHFNSKEIYDMYPIMSKVFIYNAACKLYYLYKQRAQ